MKPKKGGAMGRPGWRVSFLGHPGAKFLWKKSEHRAQPRPATAAGGGGGLLFLLFLPRRSACLQRPGAVKGALFLGAAKRTLYREDGCDRIDRGGKDLVSSIPGRTTVNHDR